MSEPSDLSRLAAFAAETDAADWPSDILVAAKACLLYGLAVGIGTRRANPALLALAATGQERTTHGSTRLLDGAPVSSGTAAFANAVLLSGRVQGDSHPCGHIGGVVIPATLSSAEQMGVDGRRLLSALVSGYEVALRIGRDHAADLSQRGFRTTPCYGVMGAAAAAGRVQGFDAQRIESAIALAANFAGGLREYVDAGTEESPFQAGFAARNGLQAADLVREGLRAAPTALHGAAGFFRAFGAERTDYGARVAHELGREFEFTAVTYKAYPACQFLRGLIRGLGALGRRADGSEPESIQLRMNPFEADFIGVRYAGPFTSPTQTVMSAPFCSALAWVTGTATFAGLRKYDDTRVLSLIPLIQVLSDPSRARYEPHIRVTLTSGSVLEWQEEAGDSEYRITWEAAVEMTYQLCQEVEVTRALATQLITCVESIEHQSDLAPLISAASAACQS